MNSVLMITGYTPQPSLIEHYGEIFHELGARVYLAGMVDVERLLADCGLDGLRSMKLHADAFGPEFFRRARMLAYPREVAQHVRADGWVQDIAREASVLVSLDSPATFAVWELARQFPEPAAVVGLKPALDAFAERRKSASRESSSAISRLSTLRRRTRFRVKATASQATRRVVTSRAGHTAMGSGALTRLLTGGRLSSGRRVSLAADAIVGWRARGQLARAERLVEQMLASLPTERERANLLGEVAVREIARGETPRDLVRAFDAELEYADSLFDAGNGPRAAASVLQAMRLAFHRAVHLDSTTTPLVADPRAFTAPLRRSRAIQALCAPRGRLQPAARDSDRPLRVVIGTHGNESFVADLRSRLGARADVEVGTVSLRDLDAAATLVRDPRRMLAPVLSGSDSATRLAERHVRPLFDSADVLFVDWCTSFIRMLNLVDPGRTRVVMRLHSYEAFTMWPHLIDLSRIDHLVFVSEHIRDLVVAQRPELAESCSTSVVPNAVDLRRFVRPKSAQARFTVGMIGFNVVAKDVLWATEVLRLLRAQDRRYRLLLVGRDFEDHLSPAAHAYGERVRRALDEFEPLGAVHRFGATTDVAGALTDAGVILCSSVREGSPVGLLEAASSGAIPVVRNWPFFAGFPHGARTLYPSDWIVETPEAAARRIIAWTKDEHRWQEESTRISSEVLEHWDIDSVAERYEEVLFGSDADRDVVAAPRLESGRT